jgi:hypothetical protein
MKICRRRPWRAVSIHRAAGIAKDRLELLQRAFMRTFKDPDLLVEAKNLNSISPVDGPTITKPSPALRFEAGHGCQAKGYFAAKKK